MKEYYAIMRRSQSLLTIQLWGGGVVLYVRILILCQFSLKPPENKVYHIQTWTNQQIMT